MLNAEAEHLIRTTQHALDDLNDFPSHHLRLKLVETSQNPSYRADLADSDMRTGSRENAALAVWLLTQEDAENTATPSSELNQYSARLDIFYSPTQVPSPSTLSSPLATFIAGELLRLFNEEKAAIAYILSNSNALGPSLQPSISGGQPSQGSQSPMGNNREGAAVMKSVAPQLAEAINRRVTRSFKYAETYHLSFSLFTPGADPSSWDIEPALQEYLIPLLSAFSPISNFSIDTQVQLFAAFSPSTAPPQYDESLASWALRKEDLSAFVNAAEWPLSPNIGKGPTINFILYVPSPSQSPLVIKENRATSWLIPQWGGVVILNPPLASTTTVPANPPHLSKEFLRAPLSTFSNQLLALLGVHAVELAVLVLVEPLADIKPAVCQAR